MVRSFFVALGTALVLSLPAQAFDMNAMNAEEREAFRAEIRAYLLENPEVLMEAIGVLEQRQAEQQTAADVALVDNNAAALFEDANSWVGGNPDGDIVLVEFMDYRCGYCRKAHDEVAELVRSDGNIRFVVKEFPILGEESTLSSRFAIATRLIAGDAAYKNVHDQLITFRGNVTEGNLRRMAERLELDATAILAAMNGAEVTEIIRANHTLGQRMGINGTPTFVLQDQLVRGYLPLDGMRAMVSEARADG